METVKKARRRGVVTVGVNNGKSGNLSPDILKARRDEATWDVQWYNFRDQKWEREGRRLTYRQAYDRAYTQTRANPYAKIGVVLLTGRRPKVDGGQPTQEVNA